MGFSLPSCIIACVCVGKGEPMEASVGGIRPHPHFRFFDGTPSKMADWLRNCEFTFLLTGKGKHIS